MWKEKTILQMAMILITIQGWGRRTGGKGNGSKLVKGNFERRIEIGGIPFCDINIWRRRRIH